MTTLNPIVAAALVGEGVAAVTLGWRARRARPVGSGDVRGRAGSAGISARFEAIVETSSDLVCIVGETGAVEYVNPAMATMLGRSAVDVVGEAVETIPELRIRGGDDPRGVFGEIVRSQERALTFEFSLIDGDEIAHKFEAIATNLLDEPAIRGVVLNCRDITERSQASRALRDREAGFRMLFDSSPFPLWVFDDQTLRFLRVNEAACTQFGYTREEFAALTCVELLLVEDRAELSRYLSNRSGDSGSTGRIWKHTTKDGRIIDVDVLASPLEFDGRPATLVAAQDVTERRELEEALQHRAFHDSLTELPNRALFRDRVEHALETGRRSGDTVVALLLDLDGFKMVNDTLGHAAGDQLLVGVANRLQTCVRTGDTVARMGGDEFAVLLERAQPGEATSLAERLLHVLHHPFEVEGQEIFVTASIGVADNLGHRRMGADSATLPELLRDADIAMYEAKSRGKDCFEVFHTELRARAVDRLTLQTDLQHAIARDQLRILYQPVVNLNSGQTVGFEALVRWDHPERGVIGPLDFVPIAEDSGLIVPIGRWIIGVATKQAAYWQRAIPGCKNIGVAVNVSGRQFQTDSLVNDVRAALGRARLDPRTLTLEITETVLLANRQTARMRLDELKRAGVRIAIDDFGTGYSSLAYLQAFPLDVMKIDKSFLTDVVGSPDRQAFLRSIVDVGRTLHLTALAEGIERPAELERLRAAGCTLGQGFLFAPPLSVHEATERLLSERELRSREVLPA